MIKQLSSTHFIGKHPQYGSSIGRTRNSKRNSNKILKVIKQFGHKQDV